MPEIIESDGDIFDSGCEALVNPVDAATGAQGAGLAKLFRSRFPEQCAWYQRHARRGYAEPGQVYHVLPGPRPYGSSAARDRCAVARGILAMHRGGHADLLVLFATTKAHYSRPSELRWIRGICDVLVDVVVELGIRSLAVPAIGCGLGDLFWADVRPLVLAAAERMLCERVVVYGPKEQPRRRGR